MFASGRMITVTMPEWLFWCLVALVSVPVAFRVLLWLMDYDDRHPSKRRQRQMAEDKAERDARAVAEWRSQVFPPSGAPKK